MNDERSCAKCSRVIRVGNDCFEVARGVLGTRGFINLESDLLCSEECLDVALGRPSDEGEGQSTPRPRRVP